MKRFVVVCFALISTISIVYALSFTLDPVISANISPVYTKYVNQETAQTGKARWDPDNLIAEFRIAASAHGLGYGQAKLQNINFASDPPIGVYSGTNTKIGIMDVWRGSGEERSTPQTKIITATYTKWIPQTAGNYTWSVDGLVSLDQYAWIKGGGTTQGLQDFATSTTGSYQKVGGSIDRSALQSSGTFKVVEKYECADCRTPADSLGALRPDHDKVTCNLEYCGVEFYKCDTTAKALHLLCEGCNDYRCDTPNRIHVETFCNTVTLTFQSERDPVSGDAFAYEIIVEGCGDSYWLCNGELHEVFECDMCNTYHRACGPHQYSGSGGQHGNNGGSGVGQNTNQYVVPGSNGGTPVANGGCNTPPANGGCNTPPANGGCTSTAAGCINPNCNSETAHATYRCIRAVITGWDSYGAAITEPCGELFTKCQDRLMHRGTCVENRVNAGQNSGRRYHSDDYN